LNEEKNKRVSGFCASTADKQEKPRFNVEQIYSAFFDIHCFSQFPPFLSKQAFDLYLASFSVYRGKCLVLNIQYLAKQRNPYFSHRFYLFIPNFCILFLFFEKRTVEVTRQFLDMDIWILAKNYLLVKYKVI